MSAYHNRPFPSSDKARLMELYDLEIAYADKHLGKLLAGLREQGLLEDTAIFLTSDHGEEFWEHGGIGHGHSMFDELLRVPGILVAPAERIRPGAVWEGQASLLSVAPTLLQLAGLAPPSGWRGKSLLPDLPNSSPSGERVYAEGLRYGPEQRALRTPEYKAVIKADGSTPLLFDLRQDHQEKQPLRKNQPAAAQAVQQALLAWHSQMNSLAAHYRKTMKPRPNRPSPEQIERLRSLGYLNPGG